MLEASDAPAGYVFLCRPEPVQDPALLARYEELLDHQEQSRRARFHFARDAHTFLIAHALVRDALSQFTAVDPRAWRFKTNEFGRPHIEAPSVALHFNLSHCNGLIACLVAPQPACGIDVEEIRALDDLPELAHRYFAPGEVSAMRACPQDMWTDRFFSLWTLKESYIKARGMGLSLPLDRFSFSFLDNRIDIRFEREIADDPARWTFTLAQPSPTHFLATALGGEPPHAQPRLVTRWYVPLVGPQQGAPPRQVAASLPPIS